VTPIPRWPVSEDGGAAWFAPWLMAEREVPDAFCQIQFYVDPPGSVHPVNAPNLDELVGTQRIQLATALMLMA
jgi:hypothetical protein